jgi:hypothetical protein
MSERKSALLIVLGLAVTGAACGHPEQPVVDQYFNALRAGDNQTLTSFAMVGFDKKVDRWSITATQPETRTPAPLPELAKKLSDVEGELAAKKKNAKIPAALTAVHEKWTEFNQKDRDFKKAVAEAKEALEREKRNVTLSVGQVDNLESLTGQMLSKQIDLAITIGGQVQPYVMTLRKYELQGGTAPRMMSRWVVQSLDPKS